MGNPNEQDFMHPHHKLLLLTREKFKSPQKKVFISVLNNGDVVEVKTQKTVYTLKVVDSLEHLVKATSSSTEHACFPGKFRVLGPIVKEFVLYLESKKKNKEGIVETVNTSAVEKIIVNGREIL